MQKFSGATRSHRRLWLFGTAVLTVLVLVLGGLLGVGWHYSDELLDPARARPDYPDTVRGTSTSTGQSTILLSDGGSTGGTGVRGLQWDGGAARVGEVVRRSRGVVERTLTGGTPPGAGTRVRLTSAVFTGDPKQARDLDFENVSVPTELGPAPAWYLPAAGPSTSTWVITVHGRGAGRDEALRVLPTLHQLGMPVLAITYRNDDGAPASPDGLYHLGATEWRDVEAAIRLAQSRGANKVVLYGWSMGGAVVGQFLSRSELAGSVAAAVLDAPVTSWHRTLDLQTVNRGLPTLLTPFATFVAGWRADIDFDRFDLQSTPPASRPPTLLFHGNADDTVPVQASRDLATAANQLRWPIEYVEVTGAEHTAEWNVAPVSYERNLTSFLTRTLGVSPTSH